ncbi:hypothetical protein B0T10DRAFT_403460 [Thelonectria olida]|uniref:Galactose oxidase n=1 Tax=Thelonectria olida TaxID=1576542 RepID=A0A9P9AR58_9HYPO|nr:hypothetical protein B0T10DRAFT_403460 [Thelonectria olida]
MTSQAGSSSSRHTRRASSILTTAAATLFLAASPLASAHSFPYVPTQLLLPGPTCAESTTPCEGGDLVYIFRQTDAGDVQFRSLNYSSGVTQSPTFESPTDGELPFLKDESDTTAFGVARTPNGTLLVYSGDCETGSSHVWSYSASDNNGWTQRGLNRKGSGNRAPNFLGGTIAFSLNLAPDMDQPTIYTYGGMCSSPTDNTTTWQGDANYTKTMLNVAPDSNDADTDFVASLASTDGPRTPIAGFTLTELTPSMTNKSGVVTQQASWVLLGGHSETAFINMSTAAVWNLPAQSWSYVDIQAPSTSIKTELAASKRSSKQRRRRATIDNVYSRSGHTATLSEDGMSIIILGGWVGDVETPAEPQLAILEMSEAYSGWQWSIPQKQPSMSIYGHGAAVLPGNVMMVYGGWEMSSSSSSKAKRQISTSTRFFNLTSNTWASSYKNPNVNSEISDDGNAPKQDGQPNSKRLGLGLGLGFGLAVLIAICIAVFCWYRKYQRRRQNRDQAVRALSQDANHFLPDHDEMMERDDEHWDGAAWTGSGQDPYQAGERSLGYESLRTTRGGAFGGPLPGLHIPRKPVVPRQSTRGYAPTGTRPTSFVSAPNQIHPIYEDDEEESYHQQARIKEDVQTPTSDAPSDPFQTPVANNPPPILFASGGRGSATPSPEGPRHDPEVQDWVSDVDAADAMLARMNSRGGQGRGSPTRRNSSRATAYRDDESRSGSNLSESARSAAESLKATSKRGTLPGPLLLAGGVDHPKPGSSSSSSYNTARSSFGALRAEGPSLLLGNDNGAYFEDEPPQPSSPSKSKPRRGWLGSLRRVFSNSSTPTSSHEDMSQIRRSFDQEPYAGDYEPGLVGLHGELLRRKQGRQGWEQDGEGAGLTAAAGVNRSPESDWDIERAVEQRLVQVMFTVPRERLRVVNGDADGSDPDEEVPVLQPQSAVLVDPETETNAGSSINEKILERDELRVKDDEKMDEKPDVEDAIVDEKLKEIEKELQRDQEDDEKRMSRFEEKQPEQPPRAQQDLLEKPPLQPQPQPLQSLESPQPLQPPQPLHLHPIHPLFHHHQVRPSLSASPSPPPLASASHSRSHSRSQSRHTRNRSRQLSTDTGNLSFAQHLELPYLERHLTHETDDSMGRRSSAGVVMEAQAMSLSREKPRTRVLAMVDSFESLSREGSPSPSPTRERP